MRFVDETVKFVEERPASALGVAAVLRFMGMGALARFAVVGIGAIWLVDQIREIEARRGATQDTDSKVDENSEESFPASDAPGTNSTTAGSPEEAKD
jgi:hypothetical protein